MKAIPEGHTHRLNDSLEFDVEFYRWPAEEGDRITPGTPEMFEIDSVWLVDRTTKDVIDITDAEGELWQHDEIMRIIENKYRL